jgi:hypothetical protein
MGYSQHGEYRLLSCQWCGLAMNVWNNGPCAYYPCKGMDVLLMRGQREPCLRPQIPTGRIDALLWDDLLQLVALILTVGPTPSSLRKLAATAEGATPPWGEWRPS